MYIFKNFEYVSDLAEFLNTGNYEIIIFKERHLPGSKLGCYVILKEIEIKKGKQSKKNNKKKDKEQNKNKKQDKKQSKK